MTKTVTLTKLDGTWVVRAGGAVIGETANAVEIAIEGFSPAIYFPRADVATAFLDASEGISDAEALGPATRYGIVTRSTVLHNAAWSYENPTEDLAAIAGHIAFRAGDRVAVEKL